MKPPAACRTRGMMSSACCSSLHLACFALLSALLLLLLLPTIAGESISLLSSTDCKDLKSAFESCASKELSTDEELGSCNFCMARSIVMGVPSTDGDCDSVNANVCTAIDQDCNCGSSCKVLLQDFMDCGLQEIFGCGIRCDGFSTGAPTSIADMATAAPTLASTIIDNGDNQCSTTQDNLQTCFAANLSQSDADTCDSCVADSIPSPISDCDSFDETVCDAIASCDCGPCRSDIEVFLNCALQDSTSCTLACDYSPTEAPAPTAASSTTSEPTMADATPSITTAAPTPALHCDTVQATLQECYTNNLHSSDALSCDVCIAGSIPYPQETDCSVFQNQLCPALSSCGCEPCGPAVQDLLNCAFVDTNQCRLDCAGDGNNDDQVSSPPSPQIAPDACDDTRNSLRTCFDAELSLEQASDCDACVASTFPKSFTTCAQLSDAVCPGMQTCSCGACQQTIERFVACAFQGRTGCTIDCLDSASPSPTQSRSFPSTTASPSAAPEVLDESSSSRRLAAGLAVLLMPIATWWNC